ncbi:hypothetical protein Tco_0652273 [Tanacetum coccineum]|uniref:Transposase-associated domain-containing protein n=1 Tax=Tanacetum coccineum TaxID=301880 RepID=A0ABQ4WX48_9ASTR
MLPKLSQIVNRLYAFIYETNHSKSGLGLPSIVALVMVIDDKSWTLLERHERAFYIGLEKFVDHCKPLVNSAGKIRCPCKSCRTILWVSIKHLSDHIMRHGFDLGYKTWVHHGEPDLPPPPPVIDNTRQPQMSDMTALLNDLSYIPPNNEHNEPTQGDIGETSNEPTQATRNEFKELYASANEELYPGCDYVTRLDFMAKFTYFKVKGKLTDSIFNEMLEFFQNVFPISKGYKLPPSYYAIKKTFKTIGLGLRVDLIHACDTIAVYFGEKNIRFGLLSGPEGFMGLERCRVYRRCFRPEVQYESDDTPSIRVLSKTTYVGHRRFLKKPHKWRSLLEFNGQTNNRDPPKEFGRDEILAQLDRLPTREKGKHPSYGGVKIKCNVHQICSATLMEDDMLKAQIKVVDILCDLELIYPPTLFNIMIHLLIHLPLEALEGGPIRPRWMFPFERYMKKLKGYVTNNAKRTVFRSVCKSIGLRSFIRFDAQELKKVKWYVLHNSLEIDTYRSPVQSLFLTRHEEEFPDWLGLSDKDPEVSTTSEFFALACGPTWTPISVNSCIVDGVSLNDLDNATLHIDGQSTEVDAPPYIIDVVDEDDDIIDDESTLSHDLADFDDEDLINVDDDGVDKMSADVARSHSGDGGGEDRPLPHYVPTGCGGCFANRGKAKQKSNLGGTAAVGNTKSIIHFQVVLTLSS